MRQTETKPPTHEDALHLQKMTDLCRLAYAFRVKTQENAEAESNSVKEALKYATLNDMCKSDVVLSFVLGGYTAMQAHGYASQIRIVQNDVKAKEKLAKGQTPFGKAVQSARQNRKEADPDKLSTILYQAYGETARLAIKAELDKEEHIRRSTAAYDEKLTQTSKKH